MFCPKCKKEVQTKREDIDWFLLIILAIFTAGFGVLIYLYFYFKKVENHCVWCESICQNSNIYITQTIPSNNTTYKNRIIQIK